MISTVFAILALVAAAVAAPVAVRPVSSTTPTTTTPTTTTPVETAAPKADLMGSLAGGAGFSASGTTAADAAADNDSGVAAGKIDGIGSVLGLAGPGFAAGAALASPSL